VGAASATASIHPAIPSKELDRCDADHWLLLARHRPEHLAVAVLKSPSVFRMPAEQLATTLRDVFLRLPQAAEFPAAAQMLAQQALAMTAPLASHPKVVAEVHALANLLSLEVLAEQDAAELAHAVREAVEAQCEEIACLEREARQVPALQAQLATALQAVRESQQQMLAGVETTRIAEHARAERDVTIAVLRTELEQARATMQRLEGELRAAEEAHNLIPRLQVLVEQSNERIVALEAELSNRSSVIAERNFDIVRLCGAAEALQEQVARVTSERDSLRSVGNSGG
jgi:hypothetical protein